MPKKKQKQYKPHWYDPPQETFYSSQIEYPESKKEWLSIILWIVVLIAVIALVAAMIRAC